jgi:hypothetical protein
LQTILTYRKFYLKLGFNIRGGSQQLSNIFVSKTFPTTLAYKCGLNEGDMVAYK